MSWIQTRIRRRASLVALLALCLGASLQAISADLPEPVVRRGFADMRWGQIHYRIATPAIPAAQRKPPLVLLHQSPLSSLEYGPLIAEMGRDRVVVALDTPGQGNSDGPKSEVGIGDYSAAIADALKVLGFGPQKPFDVLGNHTGTSLAIELALQEPGMVRQIVMTGMYMAPEKQIQGDIDALTFPKTSVAAFEQMCKPVPGWASRPPMDPAADAVWGQLQIDSWQPLGRREAVHKAAFKYHAIKKERIAQVQQKVWMIGLNDALLRKSTQESLALFKNVQYIDQTRYGLDVFRTHAVEFAAVLRGILI